jgi:pSer/pThr/pTyr-binding forkhead associated (FHA) protein
MKLIIEDDEGRKTVVPVVREEITIGRQDGNTIRLTERNVSRRHARLLKDNGSLLIEDLGSYNGVRVNGEKITAPTKIKEGDLVEIGDYDLGIQGKLDTPVAGEAGTKPTPSPRAATIPPGTVKAPTRNTTPPTQQPVSAPPPAVAAAPAPAPAAEKPAPPPPAQTQSPTAGGATAIIRVSDIMKAAPQGGEARDLDRAEMPRLVGLAGPYRAKEFYLMRSEVKFGRTEENDIVADHQSVSRQHCKFVLDQGQWKVIDNKSANGVRVNGEEYAVSNVKPGDTLELGHLKFRFCAPGEKFTPPPEKADAGEAPKGKQPTTAELIAGASQPGRMSTTGSSKAVKAGPNKALLAGIGGAVVIAAIVVVVLLMKSGPKPDAEPGGNMSAGDAAKAGDAAFKKHEYLKANEFYEQAVAGGVTPPNRKKSLEEAKGESAYSEMESALSAGDVDKARAQFEKCPEGMYWCQKAQEKGEAVKQAYAKKHLAVASAAKAAGKADLCSNEVNAVLAFDASNAEAQGIQCSPESAKPPPEKHEGPSPAERNSKAAKMGAEAYAKLGTRDIDGAFKQANDALKLNAPDKKANSQAWRVLGYIYAAAKGDPETGKKYLEKYLPYCTDDCDKVHQFTGK